MTSDETTWELARIGIEIRLAGATTEASAREFVAKLIGHLDPDVQTNESFDRDEPVILVARARVPVGVDAPVEAYLQSRRDRSRIDGFGVPPSP